MPDVHPKEILCVDNALENGQMFAGLSSFFTSESDNFH